MIGVLIFPLNACALAQSTNSNDNSNISSNANISSNLSNRGASLSSKGSAVVGQAKFKIVLDRKANEPRLQISRRMLSELTRVAGNAENSNAESAGFFKFNPSRIQTVISGIFLTFSFAFGGIWLIRFRSNSARISKIIVCLLTLALCAVGVTVAFADAADPRIGIDTLTSRTFSSEVRKNGDAEGYLTVEVVEDGQNQGSTFLIADDFRLVIPQDFRDKKNKGDE